MSLIFLIGTKIISLKQKSLGKIAHLFKKSLEKVAYLQENSIEKVFILCYTVPSAKREK